MVDTDSLFANGCCSHDEHSTHDNGVDTVPLLPESGNSDDDENDDDDDDEEYFMVDPTLQCNAVRPVYPVVAQHVVHLGLHIMQVSGCTRRCFGGTFVVSLGGVTWWVSLGGVTWWCS
jgi:hypothetical protein